MIVDLVLRKHIFFAKMNSLGMVIGRRIIFNGFLNASANSTANLNENDERIL